MTEIDAAAPPPIPEGKAAGGSSGGIRNTIEWVGIVVGALAVALLVKTFLIQAFFIPSLSMFPTLDEGDRVLVNKLSYKLHDVNRGDMVVFDRPDGQPESDIKDLIKRVIGLPGETVELRNKKVFVNGQALQEPYVHFLDAAHGAAEVTSFDVRERYGPVQVPAAQYFVMGDNRDNSQDSRYWGFLPRHYIKGKALMIYWSYESGREDYAGSGFADSARQLFSVVTHFFTRTRWERILRQIH